MKFLQAVSLLATVSFAAADDGLAAWLRYASLPDASRYHASLPSNIVALNSTSTSPVYVAAQELHTVSEYTKAYGRLATTPDLIEDAYWLSTEGSTIQILGQNERGALYGAFQYLSMLAQGNLTKVAYASNPAAPIRWTNEWDNLDGSIERGFAGGSIFFTNGTIVANFTRSSEYDRLLASIGINAIVVHKVNANSTLLTPANVDGLARIADTFRPYGVQLGILLDFASPTEAVQGRPNLTTYDPLGTSVVQWWTNITNNIYAVVPDCAGYLVKADSEGQPGPLMYNRTLADGATLFAKAVQPHGGIVMFRAFVYNQLNESDWTADRDNAGLRFFEPLDGQFDDNLVIQIKYGPIDFRVREPAHPLFVNIPKSNMAIGLQVPQEHLGQQCHLVHLPPLWKIVTDFDMKVDSESSLVRDIITGKRFNKALGGSAAVVNVGTHATWLSSHLAMSNLYAYGRLAWDWESDLEQILQDWTRLTLSLDTLVIDTVAQMSLDSWPAYENYSGNLGNQNLTETLYTHFGPNPQSQDGNGWGQWTRADHTSIGMDRTVSNGTGFAGTYPPQVTEVFKNIASTPDNLMLWFHHVNYTTFLHSGESMIQHFYNAHYSRADTMWESLKGKIDAQQYTDQLYRQVFQAGHSIVWRDAIINFPRVSQIQLAESLTTLTVLQRRA